MRHPFLNQFRKALALTTVLLLLMGLTGCFKNDKPDSSGDSQTPPGTSTAPAPEDTQAPPVPSTEVPPTVTDPPATEAPTTVPTQAPETEPPADKVMATVTAVKLNIRKEPGTQYEYVGSYPKNQQIEILEIKGDWGRTDKGWIYLDYVDLNNESEKQPQTEAPSNNNNDIVSDGKATALGYGVVTLNSLNVRTGPGTNYEKIGTVTLGSRYAYYQKTGGWVRIKDGWVSMNYLYIEGATGEGAGTGTIDGLELNIRSGPGVDFDKVGSYKAGETVKILAQVNKWGYTEKGWISLNYVKMVVRATGKGTVTADVLNIRKQAMVDSQQVGSYKEGDVIEILETMGDWGRTDKGWVFLDYVKMDTTTKTDSDKPPVKTEPKTGTGTVTANGLHIRKEPDLKAESIGGYKQGEKVEILEVKNGWGRTDKGWIYLEYVKMDS